MKATVSEKGQVTIPAALRTRLGIKPGAVLDFSEDHGTLIARKQTDENPVDRWRGKGSLPDGGSVADYIGSIRDR